MNKNVIRIINDTEAQVTKAFEKNAKIYGTEEYKLWREFKAENPAYVMVTKSIKKNPNKETNKNLTYENMRLYIAEQDNAKELLNEFERELRISKIQTNPYRHVLAWFKKKFKGYDSYKEFFKEIKKENNTETTNENIEVLHSVVSA